MGTSDCVVIARALSSRCAAAAHDWTRKITNVAQRSTPAAYVETSPMLFRMEGVNSDALACRCCLPNFNLSSTLYCVFNTKTEPRRHFFEMYVRNSCRCSPRSDVPGSSDSPCARILSLGCQISLCPAARYSGACDDLDQLRRLPVLNFFRLRRLSSCNALFSSFAFLLLFAKL